MSPTKFIRNLVIIVAVFAAIFVIGEVISVTKAVPVAQPVNLSSPVGFPADLPLPPGTVFGSSGTSPTWSVAINIDGEYTSVMRGIRTFYVSKGFTDLSPGAVIPFGFKNAKYAIQIVGRNRDHTGPLSTDITIVARLK